jgi:aspartate/methionine/tyrosine aminotransferase
VKQGAKLLVLSSPHIYSGQILSKEELNQIWNVIKDFKDLKIVFDGRYEMNNFTNKEICYFANEDMRERTLYLFGADKIFHVKKKKNYN